ncbi:putative iron-regulated transporter [Aspergillus lucknowensis]|uniref:Solute carrier family 40 member n=1 Tax=Aspergillus lucknowensis TaxID=176173 RepID=A0ABR4LLD5_9EURO
METEPFLSSEASPLPANPVLLRLYTSHFLSTWNSRMFEFGAVVFLASIFPGTLLYASVYALARSLSAVILSSWLGSLVDKMDRLSAIRHSIIWQRLPVAASCVCLGILLTSPPVHLAWALFMVLVLLAGIEKLAATANTVSVERDWAVIISDALHVPRQDLNASMRRIDLFCKLIAPVVVSLMDGLLSTKTAIWMVLGVNVAAVLVEYFAIAQVYHSVPQLDRSLDAQDEEGQVGDDDDEEDRPIERRPFLLGVSQYILGSVAPWRDYVQQRVFLASFSLSLLYLTVLSFGPTMVTFLLHSGFSSLQVSGMRIGAVVAELSGTWAAPFLMERIGPIRSGLWFLNWQFASLAAAVAAFAFASDSPRIVGGSLIVGVALSRLGLWGFDLSVQFLVQEGIEAGNRARFSATEMALQSVFEMISFATTIVFDDPDQFKYPVYISYSAIAVAAACFAAYVRRERGHLLHTSKCMG